MSSPLELHFAPTPNGWKVTIMLEECELPYRIRLVNLGAGDQFRPDFLRISPNNRMPALVDEAAKDAPLSVFESGAILLYLAEKTGKFLPIDTHQRYDVYQWLFWQVGGLGPMAGQLSHFVNYAPGGRESHEYAHARYKNEYDRLFAVMERSLARREYLAGDYSIADMAAFPWIIPYKRFGQNMDTYPNVRRWFDAVKARPAVQRGVNVGKDKVTDPAKISEEHRQRMFAQSGASVRAEAEKAEREVS